MKKRQRRWKSEQEILGEIERCQREAAELIVVSSEQEQLVKQACKSIAALEERPRSEQRDRAIRELEYQIKIWQQHIKKNCKRVGSIRDATIPRLGRILAAFRTTPMPFLGDDVAVVA